MRIPQHHPVQGERLCSGGGGAVSGERRPLVTTLADQQRGLCFNTGGVG